MVVTARKRHSPGASLSSLERGFILICQTEGKSTRTVEYYRDNLRRFLWYAEQKGWPDDARLITEWEIRDFLVGYKITVRNNEVRLRANKAGGNAYLRRFLYRL
jgi:hypothetical protein